MANSPPPTANDPDRDPQQTRKNWVDRRRDKIAEEVARNRRGEYRVPTWVLALVLVLIVGGWAALIVLS